MKKRFLPITFLCGVCAVSSSVKGVNQAVAVPSEEAQPVTQKVTKGPLRELSSQLDAVSSSIKAVNKTIAVSSEEAQPATQKMTMDTLREVSSRLDFVVLLLKQYQIQATGLKKYEGNELTLEEQEEQKKVLLFTSKLSVMIQDITDAQTDLQEAIKNLSQLP